MALRRLREKEAVNYKELHCGKPIAFGKHFSLKLIKKTCLSNFSNNSMQFIFMDLATFFKISKLKFISLEIERVTRFFLSILVKNVVKFKEFHQNLK
jgi:hypothetical protein